MPGWNVHGGLRGSDNGLGKTANCGWFLVRERVRTRLAGLQKPERHKRPCNENPEEAHYRSPFRYVAVLDGIQLFGGWNRGAMEGVALLSAGWCSNSFSSVGEMSCGSGEGVPPGASPKGDSGKPVSSFTAGN